MCLIIVIDDAGLGAGVFDQLMEDEQSKRKTIGINNAKRPIEKPVWIKGRKTQRKTPAMKELLYQNLKTLMEKGKIQLLDIPEIKQSLRSIQYDNEEGTLKIYGNYSHIAEALIRAAWCMKDKSLNLYFYS